MAQTLQTVVNDEMALAVRRAAEKEARSVSQWIALRLEEVLARDLAMPAVKAAPVRKVEGVNEAPTKRARPSQVDCLHTTTVKRSTATMGTRTFCSDCDRLLP